MHTRDVNGETIMWIRNAVYRGCNGHSDHGRLTVIGRSKKFTGEGLPESENPKAGYIADTAYVSAN